MKRFVLFIIAIVVLSGCAFDTLDKGLPLLNGKSIDTAISYLGTPDNKMQIADRNVYIWSNAFFLTMTRPVTTYSNASAYGIGGYASAYGTSTTYVPETHNHSCTIKATTDKDDIVSYMEYEGTLGGCESFMSQVQGIIDAYSPSK